MATLALSEHTAQIAVAVIAATAVIITALLSWRSSVRKSALEELRTLITEEKGRRIELEGKYDKQQAQIDCLQKSRAADTLYIDVLIAHISAGKPPPPPPRPVIFD